MACRVGITTNLERRKAEWQKKYPNLRNWKKFGPYPTKEAAQRREEQLADQNNCKAFRGGRNKKDAEWYAYKFNH